MEELLEKIEELQEEAPAAATETSALPETSAMEAELEELRKEKLHRLLMDEASMLLQERGIDPGFAAFVLAEDSVATRRKVDQFERKLSDTLHKQLASRLPVGEPRDFRAAKLPQRRRGIRKVG